MSDFIDCNKDGDLTTEQLMTVHAFMHEQTARMCLKNAIDTPNGNLVYVFDSTEEHIKEVYVDDGLYGLVSGFSVIRTCISVDRSEVEAFKDYYLNRKYNGDKI